MRITPALRRVLGLALTGALFFGAAPGVATGLTTITGTVDEWGTDNTPLAGIKVEVFDAWDAWDGSRTSLGSAITDGYGNYTISGLQDDIDIILAFQDTTDTYRDLTAPWRGLPLEQSFAITTDGSVMNESCSMISFEELFYYRAYRVADTDRYKTAVKISHNNFGSADTVVIASGASFPDALSASPLAGAYDAPLLLTQPTSLPSAVKAEITRLGAKKAFVIGSESAISNAVLSQIAAAGVTSVERIGGANRYATAEKVIYKLPSYYFDGGALPFVCRGDNFADALAASPFAYYDGFPILLTKPTSLPAETARAWKYMTDRGSEAVLVVGSTASVSDGVLNKMASYVPGGELYGDRIAGQNRYETAYAVADYWGYAFDFMGMANGGNFPDALAGGAGIGKWGGALILTPTKSLDTNAEDTLWNHGLFDIDLQCYGGTGALTDDTCIQAIIAMGADFYDIDNPDGYVTLTSISPLSVFRNQAAFADKGLAPASTRLSSVETRARIDKDDVASKFTTLATAK